MWVETIYWWIGTILFSILSLYKQKYFLKNKSFLKDTETIVKTKQIYIKTIDEQKAYLRAKNNLGKDFITMVSSIIIFYLAFMFMIYPRLPNIWIGVGAVLLFTLIVSYIYSRFMITNKHFKYNFINAFMNYSYTGIFLVYIKFIHTIHPLLLLIGGILLMIGTNYLMTRFYGTRKGM